MGRGKLAPASRLHAFGRQCADLPTKAPMACGRKMSCWATQPLRAVCPPGGATWRKKEDSAFSPLRDDAIDAILGTTPLPHTLPAPTTATAKPIPAEAGRAHASIAPVLCSHGVPWSAVGGHTGWAAGATSNAWLFGPWSGGRLVAVPNGPAAVALTCVCLPGPSPVVQFCGRVCT